MPRILVAITGHGFGHAAQTAPVVAELARQRPDAEIVLRCSLPEAVIAEFFPMTSRITRPYMLDDGVVMRSAMTVDAAATAESYARQVAGWDRALEQERAEIAALSPDLVLVNISPMVIEAASSLGIPTIAFGSLNWLDIYRGYCRDATGAAEVEDRLRHAYRQASLFISPRPALAMPDWPVTSVGPVARPVEDIAAARLALRHATAVLPEERLVLVSLGGIPGSVDLATWPTMPGIRWLVTGVAPRRADMIAVASLGLPHLGVLAGCDALITKAGYGSFVEAAVQGIPVLFAPRGDWPEEPALISWLVQHAQAEEVATGDLMAGFVVDPLLSLLSRPRAARVEPTGIAQSVGLISTALGG